MFRIGLGIRKEFLLLLLSVLFSSLEVSLVILLFFCSLLILPLRITILDFSSHLIFIYFWNNTLSM